MFQGIAELPRKQLSPRALPFFWNAKVTTRNDIVPTIPTFASPWRRAAQFRLPQARRTLLDAAPRKPSPKLR